MAGTSPAMTTRGVRLDLEASKKKVEALTAPRNAVLVGASDRPGSWAARVYRNLHKYQFPGPVYSINPRRDTIWDKPCYPDFKSLPEPPDHLVVLVPATGVAEALRSGAAAGARSATVFSAGFGEGLRHRGRRSRTRTRRGDRRNRPRGVGPELHGQCLRENPLRHLPRRSHADGEGRPGRDGGTERRHDAVRQSAP